MLSRSLSAWGWPVDREDFAIRLLFHGVAGGNDHVLFLESRHDLCFIARGCRGREIR